MKKRISFMLMAVAIIVASCDYNEKNFPGYDKIRVVDEKSLAYTMTEEDYKTTATNRDNKNLANQNDEYDALTQIQKDMAFNKKATAQKYAPAFLATIFPTLDNTSAIQLTYDVVENIEKPEYINMIYGAEIIGLNENDYDTVHGTSSDKKFFETDEQINDNMSAILKGKVQNPEDNTIVLVDYNYKPATNMQVVSELWKYEGTDWSKYSNYKVLIIQKEEYSGMGLKYGNFSGSQPKDMIPTFLKIKFPYAKDGDQKGVVYKYYSSGSTSVKVDEYIYNADKWERAAKVLRETVTDQFVKMNNTWVYNPSVTINLSPIRNEPTIMAYYQAAVDWVWETIDQPAGCNSKGEGFVSSYGNNDYYGGMSAYYNNIDMRPSKAVAQTSASSIESIKNVYANMTDEDIVAKMQEHLKSELNGMLQKTHPDATPVEGIDVIYTINMPIYEGTTITENTHTIQYKVIGVGEFEYIEDSFQPINK